MGEKGDSKGKGTGDEWSWGMEKVGVEGAERKRGREGIGGR